MTHDGKHSGQVRALLAVVAVIATIALTVTAAPRTHARANADLILATTTSTQDSGLLDALVPSFEAETGYRVKTISIGTGQAMALGERGEADVLLVHAPASEKKWMTDGHGIDRRLVMHNDFVVLGPAADPAGLLDAPDLDEVMRRIAANGVLFVSRGDNSGTHQLELQLWKAIDFAPAGQGWYHEVGQGMGQTLTIANEKQAHSLADRGTYLSRRATLDLDILAQGYPGLLNVYHVLVVNPNKGPHVNVDGARAFADFVVAPGTQATIKEFGVDRFGQPLFFPDADKTDEELGV